MQDNLKDILSNLNTDIDQETLLLYLQDKLSPEKKHEVERAIAESEFESDAMEGLYDFNDKKNLAAITQQLNKDLHAKLDKKKKKKRAIHLLEQPWTYVALLILILLIILSYFIIHRLINQP